MWDEKGEWRKLHIKEILSLHHSQNIVSMIKSRRLRWAGHLTRMETAYSVRLLVILADVLGSILKGVVSRCLLLEFNMCPFSLLDYVVH